MKPASGLELSIAPALHISGGPELVTSTSVLSGVSAVISDLRTNPPVIRTAGDNVDGNDIAYNKVFPYAATPLNGRNHSHDG